MFRSVRRPKVTLNIAARVRVFRESAGLTQEVVARKAHLAAKYISEIENGHANPSIEVLARLVEQGLGVPLTALLCSDDVDELRDDLAKLAAIFAAQSPSVRRRALRVLRALVDD